VILQNRDNSSTASVCGHPPARIGEVTSAMPWVDGEPPTPFGEGGFPSHSARVGGEPPATVSGEYTV